MYVFGRLSHEVMETAKLLMNHYNFRAAFRMFAKRYCSMMGSNFFLSHFATEKVRHLLSLYLLRSHFAFGTSADEKGITLPGALAFAERADIAGRARTIAFLRLLQLGGYLRKVVNHQDRRNLRYEATAKAIEKAKGVYRNFFIPISLLMDNPTLLSDLYNDDRLLRDVIDYSYRCIVDFRYISIFTPEMETILDMAGGYEVTLFLMLADKIEDPRSEDSVNFNYGWVSRELAIPRIQIHRIMRQLQDKGLIVQHAGAGRIIEIRPQFREMIDLLVALHLAVVWNGISPAVSDPGGRTNDKKC
ncbi:hypothetical protein [Labrys okinawensis]|nr:hypothetical protein [Labrys okinawensis]